MGAKKRHPKKRAIQLKVRRDSISDYGEVREVKEQFDILTINTLSKEKVIQYAFMDGAANIPAHGIAEPSQREASFRSICQKTLNNAKENLTSLANRIQKKIDLRKDSLEEIDKNKTTEIYFHEEFKNEREAEYEKIKKKYDGQLTNTVEDKKATSQNLNQAKADANSIVEKAGKTPRRKFVDKTPAYVFILIILGCFEAPINYIALTTLGYFNGLGVFFLSVGLGACFVMCGHIIGNSLQQKDTLRLSISSIGAVMLFSVVAVLRADDAILMLLNGVTLFIGICLAYERSTHRDYFILEGVIKSCRLKSAHLEKKENRIRENALKEKTKIDKTFWKKADHAANDEAKNLKTEIKKSEVELVDVHNFERKIITDINDYFITITQEYRSNNNKIRVQNEDETVSYWYKTPIKSLDNTISNSNRSIISTVVPCLILLMSFFGSSCSSNIPKRTDVLTVVDITHSNIPKNIQNDSICADHIIKEVYRINGSATRDYGNVIVSTFGEVSMQNTETVSLNEGETFLFSIEKERKKEVADFQVAIRNAISNARSKFKPQQYSQIYRNLCQLAPTLSISNADKKALIIFSDMIEHTRSRASFYSEEYKNDPDKIIQNYDQIVKTLEQDGKLDSLSGIEITIVHLPEVKHDELFIGAKKFWTRLFLERGAEKVTYVANI